jgi:DNA polymerase-3 subunit epsilon
LVFVDLETTGGNAAYHRITEVGIVRMRDGEVIDEWSSLVNPECRIPGYIEAFTGITNEMVAHAPRFAELAPRVREKLDAAVFVAHNARFDYAFLRTEFRRASLHFAARVMCTVKMSRRLFPDYVRHNLDVVMERHGLKCSARHRALGDARVIADLWRIWLREIPASVLAAAAKTVIGAHRLPAYLPPDLADELPEGPGVYRFFGEGDVLLYIGKSSSLRTRILGHFAGEHADAKEQKKARQTRRIDWVETAGDLGAQLKEAEWIKEQQPLYNKRLKRQQENFTLAEAEGSRGVQLRCIDTLEAGELDRCYGVFHSQRDGRKALTDIARAHSLCLKLLGQEESAGSCFAYQLGKCRGGCIGLEPLILHRTRLMMALSALKLKAWPFPGRIALREGSRHRGDDCEYHVLDGWAYLGTARGQEELEELMRKDRPAGFDVDVYRILVRHFAKHPAADWKDLRAPK